MSVDRIHLPNRTSALCYEYLVSVAPSIKSENKNKNTRMKAKLYAKQQKRGEFYQDPR